MLPLEQIDRNAAAIRDQRAESRHELRAHEPLREREGSQGARPSPLPARRPWPHPPPGPRVCTTSNRPFQVRHMRHRHASRANADGTPSDEIAVYRQSSGQWFVRNLFTVSYGLDGDVPANLPAPIAAAYLD